MCIILNARASSLLVLRQGPPALAFIRSGFPSIYLLPLGPWPLLRGFALPSFCDTLLFLPFDGSLASRFPYFFSALLLDVLAE
ncbi:hypothetical protein BKA57DRAFT_459561 [Linnemannia elongata]|nr:hypothetical protein BKA57DRAFT_459561 [Linnemannia elongata]